VEGGEKEDKLNHLSRRHKARTNWMPIILIAMLAMTIILIIPFFHETDVHVLIGSLGNIETVWVDTPYKPVISYLFPQSYPLGAYNIYITITGPSARARRVRNLFLRFNTQLIGTHSTIC